MAIIAGNKTSNSTNWARTCHFQPPSFVALWLECNERHDMRDTSLQQFSVWVWWATLPSTQHPDVHTLTFHLVTYSKKQTTSCLVGIGCKVIMRCWTVQWKYSLGYWLVHHLMMLLCKATLKCVDCTCHLTLFYTLELTHSLHDPSFINCFFASSLLLSQYVLPLPPCLISWVGQ